MKLARRNASSKTCFFSPQAGSDVHIRGETRSVPLLLLGVSSDVVLEEQTLPRNVGRVLPVLVIVELLPGFSSHLRLRIICRLLQVCLSLVIYIIYQVAQKYFCLAECLFVLYMFGVQLVVQDTF